MRVILATNEPWGTYHTEPLVDAAKDAGIDLRQWCPDKVSIPDWTRVAVTTDPAELERADLVVVNGLASDHTREAAERADAAGAALAFVELAYLRPAAPARTYAWQLVAANSPASAPVVGICAGAAPAQVQVLGWPGLDTLRPYRPKPRTLLALTSVSKPTHTGGNARSENDLLYEALEELEAHNWQITVKPHPREELDRWQRWQISDDRSPGGGALAEVELAVGVIGTQVFYTAALGVPFLGIAPGWVPDYLRSGASVFETAGQALAASQTARPLAQSHREWLCGPIGDAAERIVAAWTQI